jgi:AcrR family transcriptional regulator
MARIVKKPDERREEIIMAAREFFQTKGYEKTTMQDLIEKLCIAKGTIYHYFSSKKELLEAVVENMVDEELRKKSELMKSDRVKNLPAIEKLRILIAESAAEPENERILNVLHHPENREMHTKQLALYIIKLAPLWAAVFAEGNVEGVFTVTCPLETAEFILAGVQFLTDLGFYTWSASQLERRMKALPKLLESQLGAPAGSFAFLAERQT